MHIEVIDTFGVRDDNAMPFLADAIDPDKVAALFDRHLFHWLESSGFNQLRAIRVMRHKLGRRCLIEYDLERQRADAAPAIVTLVGKAKARRTDKATFQLLESLRHAGFGNDDPDGVLVPEPIGTIPELHMWLQRKVPGPSATELLQGPDATQLAQRVAHAAFKLHRTKIPCQRVHTINDELTILHERMLAVTRARPDWTARLQRVLAGCNRLAAALPQTAPRGIHRDFYADHIIANGKSLYLLDFDLYCHGDPALDIGNFLGHMIELGLRTFGSPDALCAPQETIEQTFVELTGPAIRSAVATYTTLTLVRHIYLSTQFEERRHTTHALLELCEGRLAIEHVPACGSKTSA